MTMSRHAQSADCFDVPDPQDQRGSRPTQLPAADASSVSSAPDDLDARWQQQLRL